MCEIFCPFKGIAYRQRWIEDHAESGVKKASLQKPDIFCVDVEKDYVPYSLDSARKQDEYN